MAARRSQPSRPFAALLFCLLTTASAYGCMCGTVTEDADRIAAAAEGYDVVFIGEVVAHTEHTSRFRIVRPFKGFEGREFVSAGKFNSCSILYSEGYYLIYAEWMGNEINTSYCSLNKAIKPYFLPHAPRRAAGGTDAFIRGHLAKFDPHVAQLEAIFPEPPAASSPFWRTVGGVNLLLVVAGYLGYDLLYDQ